ncbi:MAG: hypothetical protein Q8J74_13465 [Candidatus Didemnitutus sp.]|nr:hypothetical protein [Candidatus Didemnitutus sp.]
MTKNPVAPTEADSAIVAASAFREHGFKTLPVVADRQNLRLGGAVRARHLIARMLDSLSPPDDAQS